MKMKNGKTNLAEDHPQEAARETTIEQTRKSRGTPIATTSTGNAETIGTHPQDHAG